MNYKNNSLQLLSSVSHYVFSEQSQAPLLQVLIAVMDSEVIIS